MKIRLQQLNPVIGDISKNQQKILSALKQAESADIDLLILPELCTCGYSPMDLLEVSAFREAVYEANKAITKSTGTTALIFGTITSNPEKHGRPCFNAALMAQGGQKIDETHKTLLPDYDVFDEDRYFEQNDSVECIEWQGKKLGLTICEDIWRNFNPTQCYTYTANPVKELINQGAEAIINISASPFTVTKPESRLTMLQGHIQAMQRPIFYVNQVGAMLL